MSKAKLAGAKSSAPLTFEQGYICAVANLLRDHGARCYARDLLRSVPNTDWSAIDPYDRSEIKRHGLLPNPQVTDAQRSVE